MTLSTFFHQLSKSALGCLLVCIGTATTVFADRQCNAYSQHYYDTLIQRADHYDKNAAFELSSMVCDDCSKPLEGCEKEAVKWLQAAAEDGHKEANKLLQGKEPDITTKGLLFYRSQEIKSGPTSFRSYRDAMGYTAYYEIVQQHQVVMSANNTADVTGYIGTLYAKNTANNTSPILAIWLSRGGHAAQAAMRYFSIGDELLCLVNSKTQSTIWQFDRFEEKPLAALRKALQDPAAKFQKCSD